MKIGLIDVDGHNFPNLALMKISAHHKALGDSVSWVSYFERYDRVYMSKVFTFTPDVATYILSQEVVKGGTGYDAQVKLPDEVERCLPDYSLYPKFKEAYGFLTRGCIRRCSWCIVPKKEGGVKPYMDIEDVLQGRKSAVLMDNNILSCEFGIAQVRKIAALGCKVDFNQGLDARLVSDEVARLLSEVKWIKHIRFSCDAQSVMPSVIRAAGYLSRHGVPASKVFVYVLLSEDMRESLSRIEFCRQLGVKPFAQPYRDFTHNYAVPQWQADMARWCNRKELFEATSFEEYKPRKDFKCSRYFK